MTPGAMSPSNTTLAREEFYNFIRDSLSEHIHTKVGTPYAAY